MYVSQVALFHNLTETTVWIGRIQKHISGLVIQTMKRARLTGFTILIYIVAGIISVVLQSQATAGAERTAANLESIAQDVCPFRHVNSNSKEQIAWKQI